MSASRTATKACKWNLALKPLPIRPMPSRLPAILSSKPTWLSARQTATPLPLLFVPQANFPERRIGTAGPVRHELVSLIPQILYPHLARPEAGGGEVTEAIEERHPLTHLRPGPRGPGDL